MVRVWAQSLASAPLLQPDRYSCGAAVAVVARALTEPAGARALVEPTTSFAGAVTSTHRELTSWRDPRGGPQLPWPALLGTPPWALAHHLEVSTGLRHEILWARSHRERAWRRVGRALAAGHTVPIFLGNARLPRHVVLALPAEHGPTTASRWAVYEPAYGVARQIRPDQFLDARTTDCAWPVPWFVVVPRVSPAPR